MGKVYFFGAGNLYAIGPGATPSPAKFGTLDSVDIEFTFTKKELTGQYQFPEIVARAEGKITGKAKYARFNPELMGGMFFGITPATGEVKAALEEEAMIPASTPFTITVANGADFRTNLGVIFKDTGVALTRVATGPTTGQYSLNVVTGIYTFASADASKYVKIDYLYDAATTGKTITIVNQLMGLAPSFMTALTSIIDGKTVTMILNKCTSDKLTFPTKKGDFTIQEFDFEAFADDANEIGLLSGS